MNKKQLGVFFLIVSLNSGAYEKPPKAVITENLIPRQIEWEEAVYQYDPQWKEDETIKYGDFDGDKSQEAVVSFCGSSGKDGFSQPFHLIYKFNNGRPELVKTIAPMAEHPGEVRIIDLDRDGQKEIAIFSHSGMHYTNLLIFKYELGEYECIFENGSACGVELLDAEVVPLIKVGREDWDREGGWCYAQEPLYEIHTWNGKEFVYNRLFSSSREFNEEEEIQKDMDRFKKIFEEINKKQ